MKKTNRQANYPIHPLILHRWSPRAMTGEAMSDEELMPLFEAARWAPSSYNEQPCTILYAKRKTPEWDLFYSFLVPFNQAWCKNAACLCVFVSRNSFAKSGEYSPTHSYDTGAAWMALALEGSARELVVHGMSGFDFALAKEKLGVGDDHTVEAMCAIGKPAAKETLPPEIAEREAPSERKPLSKVATSGIWPK